MPITVDKTNGSNYATIRDGSSNTDGSLTLLGKNYSGFSTIIAENFLHLLENSASPNPPGFGGMHNPVAGQLWFDTSNHVIKMWDTDHWKQLANLTVSPTITEPTTPVTGDLWWDNTTDQLKGYTGSAWTVVGPAVGAGFNQSGPEVVEVTDTDTNPHVITKEWLYNTVIAIYSKDSLFTPLPSIAGFATINPGINFSTAVSGIQLTGKASNADKLDNLDSLAFVKADGTVAATGAIRINTDAGLSLGQTQDLQLTVTDGIDVAFTNQTTAGAINISTSGNGNISLLAGTGQLLASSSYTPTDDYSLTTKSWVVSWAANVSAGLDTSLFLLSNGSHSITGNLLPDDTEVYTLGDSGNRFSNIYATTFTGNLSGDVISTTVSASGAITANSVTTVANVAVGGNLTVVSNVTAANVLPQLTEVSNIGASGNKFANVWATSARVSNLYSGNVYSDHLKYANGDPYTFTVSSVENATNADHLLVNSEYVAASTESTPGTVVARDASADIYANIFHGVSSASIYADLAEKYRTDDEYAVGTVVMVGGVYDITAAQAGYRAIGVISENPAYLMNESQIGQAVALKGMVPVKVLGIVVKGDRLIASNFGTAVAVNEGHVDTFAIALESSENADIKLINATIL